MSRIAADYAGYRTKSSTSATAISPTTPTTRRTKSDARSESAARRSFSVTRPDPSPYCVPSPRRAIGLRFPNRCPGLSRDRLSASAMVSGPVPSVNQGQLAPLLTSAEHCRCPFGFLHLGRCVLPFASRPPPYALLAGVAVPDALAPSSACVAIHRNRHHYEPGTHPATNASR